MPGTQPKIHAKISLDEVYDYLKRFSLSDALFIVGAIGAAFKYGHRTLSEDKSVPPGTKQWITDTCPDEKDRLSLMLMTTRLARFLLLSKANDFKKRILDTGTKEMGHALFLVSNLYDERVEPEVKNLEALDKTFTRLIQWQFPLQDIKANLSARAHLLFYKIPKEIGCDYDIEKGMQEVVGMTTFDFMAVGHTLATMTNGVLKHDLTIDVESLKGVVTKDKIQKFIEVSSGTPEDYRRALRGENWKVPNPLFDIYGLDPLVQMPLIKTKRGQHLQPGCWVVPQVTYLWQRMSSGIFYILADHEQKKAKLDGAIGKNPFRDAFGKIYKHYVGLQLRQGPGTETLIDLDTIQHDGLKPDYILIHGDKALIFEIKVSFIKTTSRNLGDEEKIKEEIAKESGQFSRALNQLDSFEKDIIQRKIMDTRFSAIKEVIKVIVGYDDFYLGNNYLLRNAKKIFGDDKIRNLQIFTLMDIDTCGTALNNYGKVVEPMFEKMGNEELKLWSPAMFLRNRNKGILNKNPLLDNAFREFFEKFSGNPVPE